MKRWMYVPWKRPPKEKRRVAIFVLDPLLSCSRAVWKLCMLPDLTDEVRVARCCLERCSERSSKHAGAFVRAKHHSQSTFHWNIINIKCRWHINTPSEPFNRDSRRVYGRRKLDIAKCSVSCDPCHDPFQLNALRLTSQYLQT